MREACFGVLIQIVEKLNATNNIEINTYITELVFKEGIDTPEQLWLAVKMQSMGLDIGALTLSDKKWKNRTEIISLENSQVLTSILRETTFAHPHTHAIWDVILASGKLSIRDFWGVFVEGNLFGTNSLEQKYLGFMLFIRLLPTLTSESLPYIFTSKFMKCWTNNLSNKGNFLHKAATQIAGKLAEMSKGNKKVGFQIILMLTGVNGVKQFDKITKSKTVESIASQLDIEGVEGYVAFLMKSYETKDR